MPIAFRPDPTQHFEPLDPRLWTAPELRQRAGSILGKQVLFACYRPADSHPSRQLATITAHFLSRLPTGIAQLLASKKRDVTFHEMLDSSGSLGFARTEARALQNPPERSYAIHLCADLLPFIGSDDALVMGVLAHQLGHALLDHVISGERGGELERLEREADTFACDIGFGPEVVAYLSRRAFSTEVREQVLPWLEGLRKRYGDAAPKGALDAG